MGTTELRSQRGSERTLRCDRTAQWRLLEEHFDRLRGTLIVAGPDGEAHEHFLHRLETYPPGGATIVRVAYGKWDLEKTSHIEDVLGEELRGRKGETASQILAARGQTHKVALIAEPTVNLTDDRQREKLADWFRFIASVFQSLKEEEGAGRSVKHWPVFVQPVCWPKRIWQVLLRWWHMRQFKRPRDDGVQFLALPPLHRIRPQELLAFFDQEEMFTDRDERLRFAKELGRAKTSAEMLSKLEERLSHGHS